MNLQKSCATLRLNGRKVFEFVVRQANDLLIIEAPTKRRLDRLYLQTFGRFQRIRVQELIFSVLSAYGTNFGAPALKTLGQDKKFMRSLQDTKEEFDKRYKLFTS